MMTDVEETDAGLRVVDAAKNEVEIEIEDWKPGGEVLEIDRDVDVTLAGTASEIRLPRQVLTIESADRERLRWVQINEHVVVQGGEHLVQADDVVTVYIRLMTECEIDTDPVDDQVVISLPGKTSITFGFRSHVGIPTERVRIPPTVDGLAAALSTFGSVHKTDTPDRSYPSMRAHPPLLEVDEDATFDGSITDQNGSSTILRTPRSFESLFVVAPLVYYLGATVELDSRDTPLLEIGSIEHHFSSAKSFPEEVAALLSRVFYLDCLVRNAGPYGVDIHELDRIDGFPLDIERLYSLPTNDRLAEYLDVPFERIADRFPEWPLAVSTDPTIDNISAIPHLLECLSLIFPPVSKPVDERSMLAQSLDDSYRAAPSDTTDGKSGVTDLVEPEHRRGVVHGWIADGTPVGAFKCLPEAFANRLDYLDQSGPLTVAVILNDDGMGAEFSQVVKTYQGRAEAFSIEVDVLRELGTEELATTFEDTYDFVHYIGHCDLEGLRCHDGNLSTSSLSTCNVQAFFLNACRSYDQGLELIRRGSVAGAVTIGDVLDEQARKVGVTFARVLGRGYGIKRALRLARARAIMNRHYAIVGDGTHELNPGQSLSSIVLSVAETAPDTYRVRSDSCSPKFHGAIQEIETDSKPVIVGNDNSHRVSGEQLERYLLGADEPILFDGKLYWPEELLEELF